jgi:SAM-dependent methyltransferase
MHDRPELSDLIVDYDPVTLARRPVRRDAVLATLRACGASWAARIAAALPARDGVLDEAAVDATLVRSHLELQRLHEEFLMGLRVAELLRPLLSALRAAGAPPPLRVVDLGCGIGYVVRWLARRADLGADVELIGADYNGTLVGAARRLAAREGLRCSFVTGNALALAAPATVLISTGVLHHFRGAALAEVLRQQARSPAQAMLHFDIKPSPLAPLGSFIFHQARMREPLARHDGYLSALRAHPEEVLLAAAAAGAAGLRRGIVDGRLGLRRLARIMHGLLLLRPPLEGPLLRALGAGARRLSALEGP